MSADQERHLFRVFRQEFIIDKRFQIIKELGHGAYGLVVSAKYIELPNGGSVAIKKITNIFSKKVLCKRAIREIKLLKHFTGHKNITALYDLDIVDPNSFNEVYLYEELMECDLHQIIKSGQPLTDAHYQSFVYQILCGLKYIHSADVLHRDLKPGNLLVNADCELKICDFGLARGFSTDAEKNAGYLTEYVATRWYRAPEIMLSFHSYSKAIDIWSVGCILAELLGGKPFFKGKDYVDQLNQILRIIGTPNEETLVRIGSKRAQSYVRSLPFMPKVPFSHLFPDANIEGLDLLEKMLALDPSQRVDVDQALTHPYLKVWHDPAEEIVCAEKFDFSFESLDDFDSMKQLLVNEVKLFREFVRKPQLTPEEIQQQELQQQQDLLQHQHQQQQQQILQQQQQQQQQQQSILSPTQFAANGTSTNQYYDDPPKPQENIYYTNQYSVQNDGNNGLNHQISQNIHNGYSHDGLYQHQGLNGSKGDLLTGLEQELEFGLDGQGFYKS